MKVSPQQPFQIIYSFYKHQFLGCMLEAYIVALDKEEQLTLKYQLVSSANAHEFSHGLTATDFELVKLISELEQETVMRKHSSDRQKVRQTAARHAVGRQSATSQFFYGIYDKSDKNASVREAISQYTTTRISKILNLLKGKRVFEMANDGEPTHKKIVVEDEAASVHFNIQRHDTGTKYYPTLEHNERNLDFKFKEATIVCAEPAWLLLDGHLYHFKQKVSGNKLRPFLNKHFVSIPKKIEETYYQKFVASLIEDFYVKAQGFHINTIKEKPTAVISISTIPKPKALMLFGETHITKTGDLEDKIRFKLRFNYADYSYDFEKGKYANVSFENDNGFFRFNKIKRSTYLENKANGLLSSWGLPLKGEGVCILPKTKAFSWLNDNLDTIKENGFLVQQDESLSVGSYFIGKSTINFEISEKNDWFDIKAVIKFGNYEIPFLQLKKVILSGKTEFTLPNGEIAVIPSAWLTQYEELFHFTQESNESLHLKKHHLALVLELQHGNNAKITLDRKLGKLKSGFSKVENYPISKGFKGTLRPYQQAGYNWLHFLNDFNFGGCLADDMGLGKTVQTLALLQKQKDEKKGTSLLIMPTSLLYNWKLEAKKFTPSLKVLLYTGTYRNKDVANFANYDLVLTSYGIARLDIEILRKYYFNYAILDESQIIKNPASNIAQAVLELKSKSRLILTGTPVENSTLDLWSQMNFIIPNLLGTQNYFKKHFQIPIEKQNNPEKKAKLHAMIKPFVMRRHKSQVATDLPEKIEKIQYCEMTSEQEEAYEKVKSAYRNKIIDHIEQKGVGKSQMLLLQGLTMLRQLANHPKMVDADYAFDSGKLKSLRHLLTSAICKGHKILVFSQFVKHLQIVKDLLEHHEADYSYLDGSTKDRQQQVDEFQNNPNKKVFLISLKAGGVGLNLTAADYVFILDPWWNPAAENQAIDRAHRIGQKNKVMIYKFITQGTVEEKILALQQSKLQLANDLITTEKSFMKKLSQNDIYELLT